MCDNIGAQSSTQNHIFHAHTKHIEIDHHFVRDQVVQGRFDVQHVNTMEKLADVFTKSLPSHEFLYLRIKLMVLLKPSI